MKKIFALNIFVALVSIIPGCILIPTGEKIVSEQVIGERKAQDGQASEQILKMEGIHNYYVPISPEGCGIEWHDNSFYKFYLKRGENRILLSHIPFTPQEYDVLRPVLPVQGSAKWIAARPQVEHSKVNVELIVFDEKRIYRTLVVKECVRTNISKKGNLFNYGIDSEDGNTKITFNTNNGEYLFDVIKNTFEKK